MLTLIFPCIQGRRLFYNGTQQSFMDECGNWIYLRPTICGIATMFAGAWRFRVPRYAREETVVASVA